jgi:hypothetical protein
LVIGKKDESSNPKQRELLGCSMDNKFVLQREIKAFARTWACIGLSPTSHRALPGAQKKSRKSFRLSAPIHSP